MNVTPPPPNRRRTIQVPGTPLLFKNNNNNAPKFHMYENKITPNTPHTPIKMSRKRTRINTNSNNYNSNNYNNNHANNNNYIRPQKVISNKVKSLRDECDEHIKQMDLNHDQMIDDLLRDKKNDIDNIDKKYEKMIIEKNKKNEDNKLKILNECKKIEKTVKNQELNRKSLRRTLFRSRRA
jgi:hypothetical protein